MVTIEEMERRHQEEIALKEKVEKENEERKEREIAEMGSMSMGEYIARRNGTEYVPPENLEGLSMEEYIKCRSGQ